MTPGIRIDVTGSVVVEPDCWSVVVGTAVSFSCVLGGEGGFDIGGEGYSPSYWARGLRGERSLLSRVSRFTQC